jgi:hypothetical protein
MIGRNVKGHWDSEYFIGSIDDVRIYNRALTEKEVAALYEFEKVNPGEVGFNASEVQDTIATVLVRRRCAAEGHLPGACGSGIPEVKSE